MQSMDLGALLLCFFRFFVIFLLGWTYCSNFTSLAKVSVNTQ